MYNWTVGKLVSIILVVAVLLGGFLFWQNYQKQNLAENVGTVTQNLEISPSPKPIHIHAAFLVFSNSTYRPFTNPKYHERRTEVHLNASNPRVIHIHAGGITWRDFFDSMPSPMKVSADCLIAGTGEKFCNQGNKILKFYLKGERKDASILSREIKDGDRFLMSYGAENEEQIQKQIEQVPDPSF